MSDTRNHTTRDQLAAALREHDPEPYFPGNLEDEAYYQGFADALLASDAIAAVRAAAVAETTAAIEAECDRLAQAADRYDQAEQWSYAGGLREAQHHVRAALSGGRTALDTTLNQARAEGWEARDKARPQYLGPTNGHYEDCMGWHDCYCGTYPNPYRADTGADQ